jgi:hypothetical protein
MGKQMTASPILLTNSHIIVGNGSNQGADVAMSGSIQISNTGATSINPSSTDAIPGTWTGTTAAAYDCSPALATNEYADNAAATSIHTEIYDDSTNATTDTNGTLDLLGSQGNLINSTASGDGYRILLAGVFANPNDASTAIQQRLVVKLDTTTIFDTGLLKIEDSFPSGGNVYWSVEIDLMVGAKWVSRFQSNAMLDKTAGYSQEAKAPLCQFGGAAIDLTTGTHAIKVYGSTQGTGAQVGDVGIEFYRIDKSTAPAP